MLLRPQPPSIMQVRLSHASAMQPLSPLSPWGGISLSVPPNSPSTQSLASAAPRSSVPHPGHRGGSSTTTAGGPTEIIPRLYISDLADAENRAVLASLGITHVFSAMPGFVDLPSHNSHAARSTPIQRCQIHLEDHPFAELATHLPTATAFIREALRDPEARVLVHCQQGISRSSSVVCAYLMSHYDWPPSKAVSYVKGKRWIAEPNFGFVTQLHEFEKTLKGDSSSGHGYGGRS